jgi:hypothetical protein
VTTKVTKSLNSQSNPLHLFLFRNFISKQIELMTLNLEIDDMKKTLIALAVLAASGASFAQSTVTLSGVYGVGIAKTTGSVTALGQTDGGLTISVSEDLGGGMKLAASQTLAFGKQGSNVAADGGSMTLSGGFGAAKFGTACAGAALGEAVVGGAYHFAHALGTSGADCREYQYGLYTAPELVAGLTAAVRIQNMAAGGVVNLEDFSATGNGLQARFNYNVGAFTSAFYAKSNSSELHLGYNLGVVALKAGFDTQTTNGLKRSEFGATIPMGAATISMGYGMKTSAGGTADIKGTQIGASYALSKRTSINAVFGSFENAKVELTPAVAAVGETPAVAATYRAVESSSRINLVHTF